MQRKSCNNHKAVYQDGYTFPKRCANKNKGDVKKLATMKKRHFVDNYILNPYHKLTVDVIGCGGTGSQILTSLGRMNYALQELGHPGLSVTAYDADIVSPANCGRQLFSEQEIGTNKAETLVTKLNMFFGTDWDAVPNMYEEGNQPTSNLTISCVDTAKARIEISKCLAQTRNVDEHRQYYWLDFGNTTNTGQIILGTLRDIKQPKKKGCVGKLKTIAEWTDLSAIKDKDSGPSCSLAEALTKQDLFINSALCNAGCALLWKMFSCGVLDYQGVFLNLQNLKMNPLQIEG